MAKKITQVDKKIWYLDVIYKTNCLVLEDTYGHEGPYTGYTHDSCSYVVERLSLAKNHGDLVVGFEPNIKEKYYLLYAVYSTGDSFSRHEGGGIYFVDLYKDLDLAELNKKIIEDNHQYYKNSDNFASLDILDQVGNLVKLSPPWQGYFEELDYIAIEPIGF